MSKDFNELAAELTREIAKARGLALQNADKGNHANMLKFYLSDEAIESLYDTVMKALVRNA